MKIVLISCASKKLNYKEKAENLYISNLFRLNLLYAKSLADKIFVLSAKYGLLDLNTEIEPYDETLNYMSDKQVKEWSNKVLEDLRRKTDLEKDSFIFLAGEKYRKYLIQHITKYEIPLKGLGIGKQLKYLKDKTSK